MAIPSHNQPIIISIDETIVSFTHFNHLAQENLRRRVNLNSATRAMSQHLQQIRLQLKEAQSTIKEKDDEIVVLKRKLDHMTKRKDKHKKRSLIQLSKFVKDPDADSLFVVVSKSLPPNSLETGSEESSMLNKKDKKVLGINEQIFFPADIDERLLKRDDMDEDKLRQQREQERDFSGILGQHIRTSMVSQKQTTINGNKSKKSINTLAEYQHNMISTTSSLKHLTHAIGTGQAVPSSTVRQFTEMTTKQQRGEMKAYNALCCLLAAVSDQNDTTLTSLLTSVTSTYKGQIPKRIELLLVRIGLAKTRHLSADRRKQLEIDSNINSSTYGIHSM